MNPERAYRSLGFGGTVVATVCAVLLAHTSWMEWLLGGLPWASLSRAPQSGTSLALTLAVSVAVTALALGPLYRPRSRRILDTIAGTLRALAVAFLVFATLGYFGFPYRLPRSTLVVAMAVLAVALPLWFVFLQGRYIDGNGRTLVVGHDRRRIETAIRSASDTVVGYASSAGDEFPREPVGTDGGHGSIGPDISGYECLGGLTRLDEILAESNIGTVVPALPRTDRGEFFGVLNTCYRHGVDVEVPDEHGERLLLDERDADGGRTEHVSLDLHPWDVQDRLLKRCFDVCFAGAALLAVSPLLCLLALAVKLDSPGPVFYRQERTALFGDTFHVYKFRTMLPESEAATPGADGNRVTRVGRVLRRTHLDEIPQLWAILRGQMSVVGPRAAWTAEEDLLLEDAPTWQKRWFVKPGLTGLAQINEVSSETPEEKLQCDLTYIREQSLRFDAKILVRQFWLVATDAAAVVTSALGRESEREADTEAT